MKKGALKSSDNAVEVTKQHKKPCKDCPWLRTAIAGWLGGLSPEEWIRAAHADDAIECHTRYSKNSFVQCAGASIYRANVLKSVRPNAFRFLNVLPLELPADRTQVFATPAEFQAHHRTDKEGKRR